MPYFNMLVNLVCLSQTALEDIILHRIHAHYELVCLLANVLIPHTSYLLSTK